ncbi:MAG: class I adenylate-forming enzyme family protein [Oscillospiraceae bacterium]|jgi:acyl-coenzyme A synthetase/AMP-(fatty) acid ligase
MRETGSLTGKASVDRPWLKYYPPGFVEHIVIPECTLTEYLRTNCADETSIAMHYYGNDIPWKTVFEETEKVARALRAVGFGEGDQIPMFLRAVPEFIYLLLATEKIGASLLCRDNTLEENIEATAKAGASVILSHDYLSESDLEHYLADSHVKTAILLDPLRSADRETIPDYIIRSFNENYTDTPAHGSSTMSWDEFLALGETFNGQVSAPVDIHRPLFRAYTSGSTGPSKQVIHSANTMIGVIHQMNFYGSADGCRPTWLITCLPPTLVAVVVAMILLPLASNKLLILDPFVDPHDVDLELMRYRPNCWPLIPMFIEIVMRNGRIPEDHDLSYLQSAGAGCEAYNNGQMKRAQKFLHDHNCMITFTTGYGSSEAGSNVTLPMAPFPIRDGNVGIPMPLTDISIFKYGTTEECGYNEIGEICKCGPGNMLGYDTEEATAKSLMVHDDGKVWLHMGDTGYITEDGVIYTVTRGESPRFGGGDLGIQPMENLVADAEIEGIDDEFFVIIPDDEHEGYFLPYLYVVLEEGYTIEDIRESVNACLEPYMVPIDILAVPERPFFHFKTNRIGLTRELLEMRKNEKK